jgi:hypothetical protein
MVNRILGGSMPVALLVMIAGLASSADAGSIVLDGSFEGDPPIALVAPGVFGDGWISAAGTVDFANTLDFGGMAAPHSGNQYAYLDQGGGLDTLTQVVPTTIGTSYLISYWIADTGPDLLTVTFGAQTLFTGTAPSNGVGAAGDYVQYTFAVTAVSNGTGLSFEGQTAGFFGTLVDDVSVTATSSVPEPATLGFTALGCFAVLALRRRRAG